MNRRCLAGKHSECNGKSWDFEWDAVIVCRCLCHKDKKAA